MPAPRLAWQAALKKIKVKLDLWTDIDMLLMVKKGIRGKISHAIHPYVKANNKYSKDYDKNKESLYLKYWDMNILYRWAMSLRLPVYGFKWVEEKSQFNKDFKKSFNEDSDKGFIKNENCEKWKICSQLEWKKNVINKRNLKRALNHRLVLIKV